jgi:hypothetical protein
MFKFFNFIQLSLIYYNKHQQTILFYWKRQINYKNMTASADKVQFLLENSL